MTIPEFRLVPEPADEAAAAMRPAPWAPPEVGNRHKIGGRPDLLQDEPFPACPGCGATMAFYGQLDSLGDEDRRYDIADCGMVFVFLCFDCFEARAVVQSG